MGNKRWGRLLATAMATALTVTSVPFSVSASQETEEGNEALPEQNDGYNLVWSDDFDGDTLNTDDWNVEEHEPGWVNSELQRYTALDEGNIKVSDGCLHIIPKYTKGEDEESETNGEFINSFENFKVDVNVGADKPESETIALQINFGKIKDEDGSFSEREAALDSAAKVSLTNISLIDVTEGENHENMLSNGYFSGSDGWTIGINEPAKGSYDFTDSKLNLKIDNAGTDNWHIQLQQGGIKLIPGHEYVISMDATSDIDRVAEISLLDPVNGYNWYGGGKVLISGSGVTDTLGTSKSEITSGRISTQGKHDYTYGRFEARAKVPTGMGFLPAFWLMASDEGFYGQWPKCGELDIMEVMGQQTNKSYHTIHYGYDSGVGHNSKQGTLILPDGDYASEFHVFRADWEPGKITWYVDDEKVYETSDWYTGTDDDNQITYPAPFDQNFYIILNLAVGGSWVGYPEDKEAINGEEFTVDYVKVYQKDESVYDEQENNVKRPEKEPVAYREADEEGNYVVNGNFVSDVVAENSPDANNNWVLHLESDAAGSYTEVKDNSITITPSAVGAQNHSVQLKQGGIPMYKGWEYELSFDAYSTEDRKIVVDVEGPDHGWIRYMEDTTVAIQANENHYTLNFTMNEKTDPNAALEFNLGNQGVTSPVVIKNVKLIHKSGEEIKDEDLKEIRPDGNYIYNGSFDQGDKRLGYWEFDEKDADNISVTKTKKERELMVKVEVPEGTSEANPVTISQTELAPLLKGQYELSFNAYYDGGESDGLTCNVMGEEYIPALTNNKTEFRKAFNLERDITREESKVEFSFTKPGTYFLDDVFLTEKALIKNGSFSADLAGWNAYAYRQDQASAMIDNMNGNDHTFVMTINDTLADDEPNDWYIQLIQDNITLEEGKYYKLGFKAKSSIDRSIKYCLQEFEGNWTNYSDTGVVEIGNEWKEFSSAFCMQSKTDTKARFNITMGSVGGKRITEKHDVYIDDIELIELTKEEFEKLTGNQNAPEIPSETPSEEPSEQPSEQTPQNPEDNTQKTPSDNKQEEIKATEPKATETVEASKQNNTPVSQDNNNGKAEKGEIKVTKNAIYKVIGKKSVSYAQNPDSGKKSVTVPASVVVDKTKVKVTKITKKAFKGNKKLKKVTLGKNITSIGKSAFSGCTKLKSITVKGDRLKKVDKTAFKSCKLGKDFKVIIKTKDSKSYERIVNLFKDAGLTSVTFIHS